MKEIMVYESFDGKRFTDKDECERYEHANEEWNGKLNHKLLDEYLSGFDDDESNKDEWYGTQRDFATEVLYPFFHWLKERGIQEE